MKITFSPLFKKIISIIVFISVFLTFIISLNFLQFNLFTEATLKHNPSVFLFSLLQFCIIILSIIFVNMYKQNYINE